MQNLKICTGCNQPHTTEHVRCQECRLEANERIRRRAQRLKEEGKCQHCGQRPAIEGITHCSVCTARNRKYYESQKASGIKPFSKTKNMRRLNNLCVLCGQPSSEDKKNCQACLLKNKKRTLALRSERKAVGNCIDCDKDTNHPTSSRCLHCSLRLRGYKNKLPWQTLIDLWDSQKGICPMSGIQLDQTTADLDHIIPKSKGGSNDISNVRFIHTIWNAAKLTRNDEEVIDFINKCYHHLN